MIKLMFRWFFLSIAFIFNFIFSLLVLVIFLPVVIILILIQWSFSDLSFVETVNKIEKEGRFDL